MKFVIFLLTFSLFGCLKFEEEPTAVQETQVANKTTDPDNPVFLESTGPLNTLQYVSLNLSGSNFNLDEVNKIEISGTSRKNSFTLVDEQIKTGVNIRHLVDPGDTTIIVTIWSKNGTTKSFEFPNSTEAIDL